MPRYSVETKLEDRWLQLLVDPSTRRALVYTDGWPVGSAEADPAIPSIRLDARAKAALGALRVDPDVAAGVLADCIWVEARARDVLAEALRLEERERAADFMHRATTAARETGDARLDRLRARIDELALRFR